MGKKEYEMIVNCLTMQQKGLWSCMCCSLACAAVWSKAKPAQV